MTLPTAGEEHAKLMEFLRKAQEAAATLSHLAHANSDRNKAMAWMAVSENFKKMQSIVTDIAIRGRQ